MSQKRVLSTLGLVLVLAVAVGGCSNQEDGAARAPRYSTLSEFEEDGRFPDTGFLIRGRIRSLKKRPIAGATVSLYDSRELKAGRPGELRQAAASNERGEYQLRLYAPFHGLLTVEKPGFASIQEDVNFASEGAYTKSYILEDGVARIEGRVLDGHKQPIAGAGVSVGFAHISISADASHSDRTVLSDASGYFTIDNLPEGPAAVVAWRVEWDLYRDAGKQVEQRLELRRQETHNLEFVLSEAQVVRWVVFVVKNERGEAISGAGAEVEFGGSGGLEKFSVVGIYSDERGRIRLNVSPGEMMRCEISAAGYLTRQIVLDPDLAPADVVLQKGPLFMGTVLSESGHPLQGAEVTIPGGGSGRTDGSGHFAIRLSQPAVSRMEVSRAGYLPEVRDFGGATPTFPVEVRLKQGREGGGIYGRVVDPDGDPVERFDMYLAGPSSEGPRYSRLFEHPEGIFTIFDLPAGDFELMVQSRVGRRRFLHQTVGPVTVKKGEVYGELVIRLELESYQ